MHRSVGRVTGPSLCLLPFARSSPDLDRPVELWVRCRMTHVCALAYLMGRPGAGALVDHGLVALSGRFRDQRHGGWFAQVSGSRPTATAKTAYEHAFVVLAAASATAAGRPHARETLDEALRVFNEHFWDDEYGMVVEEWDESFSNLDGYRGVNANMHTVEALLTASDVLDDPLLRQKAERIVTPRRFEKVDGKVGRPLGPRMRINNVVGRAMIRRRRMTQVARTAVPVLSNAIDRGVCERGGVTGHRLCL